jgi:small subunit ribosomal protein S7
MPRRREIEKRKVLPDPKYHSAELSKFINVLMERGKKSVAEKIVYDALEIVKNKTKKNELEVFMKVLDTVKPLVELKSRRVGGANYQIPVEVIPSRQIALAMCWIRDAARKRGEKSMGQRLGNELVEALDGRGAALKRRDEVHKMAEANKAFAHFRF